MRPNKHAALLAENESLAELAYRVIRERILAGEYSLGETIPRRELAAGLGMSIVPVNDALARLEHEYLIENSPRVGTRVRVPTPSDLRGFWAVREGLETQSARLFVRTASAKERRTLLQMAQRLDRLHDRSTKGEEPDARLLYKWRCAHMRFHTYIAECTQLPFLCRAIERNQLLVFSWFYDHQLYGGSRLPPRWHEQLARALAQSAEEVADSAMRDHLHNRLEELMRRLERFLAMDESRLAALNHRKPSRVAAV
jgi:GntR family transcriptional regulator, rspAB operon transcriptional repressor